MHLNFERVPKQHLDNAEFASRKQKCLLLSRLRTHFGANEETLLQKYFESML